jgi:outer membrane autotransporter protein
MKFGFSLGTALKLAPVTLLAFVPQDLHGACSLVATPGNDINVCDSGSAASLLDTAGDNSLTFPAGGTGAITGAVVFGDGQDRIDMSSGLVGGNVSQAGGRDTFTLNGGSITGDITQGPGTDTFSISGGTVRSVLQGDGLDTFTMIGGTISNAFEDGDSAAMSGGTIGRVDMKLDDNLFDLSGGRILGNLVTGFGRDTIIVSGGSVGGAVSVSGGDDQVTVTGGEIIGEVRTSFGNDRLAWRADGYLRNNVLLADGDDSATLENLDEAHLSATPLLDGGPGNDSLAFINTTSAGAAQSGAERYVRWESVSLSDNSNLALTGPLTLGDGVSGSGTLQLDASSRLTATTASLGPFLPDQRVTLTNAGTLDMTTGSGVATDTLRINGNYVGDNGQLWLQTVLGDDTSASDRLIVAGGSITGSTQLTVTNLAGAGASTRLNGIEVVQATEGATSENTAFSLKNALSAGPFQYYLFKGGATAGSENSWFLRSAVVSPASRAFVPPPDQPGQPAPAPTPLPDPTPDPAPEPGPQPQPEPVQPAASLPVPAIGTPPLPAAAYGAEPVPLYRLEVPTYAVMPPAAAMLTLASLGTFHERQGDQSLLTETGAVPAGWARILGEDIRQRWSGTASPKLDATVDGYQIGHDLYARRDDNGHLQRGGLFVAHSRLEGHVDGFAQGLEDQRSGKLEVEGDSLGAYWTLIGHTAWYVDVLLMGTRLDVDSRSERGVRLDTDGHGYSASVEAGYPLPLSANWVLEPQAQAIHQRIELDSQHDGISLQSFDADPRTTGRLGARLKGRYPLHGAVLEPWMRANLWRTFDGEDQVTFNHAERIETRQAATRADLGLGLTARLSPEVSLYASGDYSQNLDDDDYRGLRGTLGLRVSW